MNGLLKYCLILTVLCKYKVDSNYIFYIIVVYTKTLESVLLINKNGFIIKF